MSFAWLVDETVQPEWAVQMEERINRKIGKIMALVQVEQADLDQLDADLDAATAAIVAKIEGLSLPPAQLDSLKADLEALRSLGAPAPVEPPAE